MNTAKDEPTWGAKINMPNRSYDRQKAWPAWVPLQQQRKWHEPGLVVWDSVEQQVLRLQPPFALDLLKTLYSQSAWKTEGIAIGETVFVLPPSPANRQELLAVRSEGLQAEETPGSGIYKLLPGVPTIENFMQLTPGQAEYVLTLLESYEQLLQQAAARDAEILAQSLGRTHRLTWAFAQQNEAKALDLSARPFPWTYDAAQERYTCDSPPNHGSVTYIEQAYSWRAWVKREGDAEPESKRLPTFEAALSWVEQRLPLPAEGEAPRERTPVQTSPLTLATLPRALRARLKRYWIEPQRFEPPQVTYRAAIYIDHLPTHKKEMKLSTGATVTYVS